MSTAILLQAARDLRAAMTTGDAGVIRSARRAAYATMSARATRGGGYRETDTEAREALSRLYRETEPVTGETWVSAAHMGDGTPDELEAFARGYASLLRTAFGRLGWQVAVRLGTGNRTAQSTDAEQRLLDFENAAFDRYCAAAGDAQEALVAMVRAGLLGAQG